MLFHPKLSEVLQDWLNMPKCKKDYAYRSTWKHKFSRARNLAQRGGLTKPEMLKKYGRFPKKNEWWGPEENYKAWMESGSKNIQNPASNVSALGWLLVRGRANIILVILTVLILRLT